MNLPLDIAAARRVQEVIDAGLCRGAGKVAEPGKVCLEQAIAIARGLDFNDAPACVAKPDRDYGIRINDGPWPSDAARARGLRRIAVMQLGTVGTDRVPWVRALALGTIREVLPLVLRLRPEWRLEEHAVACERATTLGEAREAALAAKRAAYVYAATAATTAATTAADAATTATTAADAAAATAATTAADAAADAAAAAAEERLLLASVRVAERAYEETGSPGLDLLREIEAAGEAGS